MLVIRTASCALAHVAPTIANMARTAPLIALIIASSSHLHLAVLSSFFLSTHNFPTLQPRLCRLHQFVEDCGDHRNDRQRSKGASRIELAARALDEISKPPVGSDHLSDNHANQRIGQSRLQAYENPRHR